MLYTRLQRQASPHPCRHRRLRCLLAHPPVFLDDIRLDGSRGNRIPDLETLHSKNINNMNSEFLVPFLALLLSISWLLYAKAACESNYESVVFFDTVLFNMITSILLLCAVAGLIISWIAGGFMVFLAYLGIAIAAIYIARFTTSRILVAIFGYAGIGGCILPPLCAIASAVWMFSNISTF